MEEKSLLDIWNEDVTKIIDSKRKSHYSKKSYGPRDYAKKVYDECKIIEEYAYKFLLEAYEKNISLTSRAEVGFPTSRNSDDRLYDAYRVTGYFRDHSYNLYLDDSYINITIRSNKYKESTRPSIKGVYSIYFGNSYSCIDINVSYCDTADESKHYVEQMYITDMLYRLITKIIKNSELEAWLLVQGINVRNIL